LTDLWQELERLRSENAELRRRLGLQVNDPAEKEWTKPTRSFLQVGQPPLTADSSSAEKITCFRNLFRGREDVYAVHWINERTGKKGYAPAVEDPWNSRKGKPKKYLPLTDHAIHDHLVGEKVYRLFGGQKARVRSCIDTFSRLTREIIILLCILQYLHKQYPSHKHYADLSHQLR
jgi:hypothetical protein